ncbi:uncharacterized protein MEPE_05561 [Melanopsichium pennsylvanicum]|uniref:Uncharacterized protein n=1 Tax=Melanopsichium pennsylvanicum TaxID=63383 RepID=A0AAJ5C7F1_9BASI|nr:uncharacterized protein MEPE_05561 [Melanopsichium pennsylvanicum]
MTNVRRPHSAECMSLYADWPSSVVRKPLRRSQMRCLPAKTTAVTFVLAASSRRPEAGWPVWWVAVLRVRPPEQKISTANICLVAFDGRAMPRCTIVRRKFNAYRLATSSDEEQAHLCGLGSARTINSPSGQVNAMHRRSKANLGQEAHVVATDMAA